MVTSSQRNQTTKRKTEKNPTTANLKLIVEGGTGTATVAPFWFPHAQPVDRRRRWLLRPPLRPRVVTRSPRATSTAGSRTRTLQTQTDLFSRSPV